MKEQLEAIRKGALEAIAAAQETAGLEALRVKYLGKKGELTAVLKQMGACPPSCGPSWASWPTTSGPAWKPPLSASLASSPKRLWKPGWRRRPWT